jgi:hypothetical protein
MASATVCGLAHIAALAGNHLRTSELRFEYLKLFSEMLPQEPCPRAIDFECKTGGS